ncbi:trypsin-like peptidase domain-containing protein [Candidatus Kaiserbacteria bacterium]|nr:trypsin-like peptidase domain-containing protein [Candidatus Kaiserbacteria bacterium]
MSYRLRSLLTNIGALALIVGAFVLISNTRTGSPLTATAPGPALEQSAQTAASAITGTSTNVATTSPAVAPKKAPPQTNAPEKSNNAATNEASPRAQSQQTPTSTVARIQDPYSFPPLSFDVINTSTRMALVNILCMPQNGSLRPISGSGVIIDPRGVILTNAHVAQYVLLSESPQVDLSCFIRDGSPAAAHWRATVLYIPPAWVEVHASDIKVARPTGTGEYDYALLLISDSLDGSPLPAFSYLPVDTREGVAFLDDQILAGSYPAEFLGGIAAQYNLYSASSVTTIKQLLTFSSGTIDLLSLGGIIEAQSGSSGGAVVNAWGHLVGIISTTSEGDTTADRDLRAISLSYIDRSIAADNGFDLRALLAGDVAAEATDFKARFSMRLTDFLITQIQN